MSRGRRLLVRSILSAALAAGCTNASDSNPPAERQQPVIRVTGQGSDERNSVCQGFRLSEEQAREFFSRSVSITEKELHDDYDYLPCWVEGTTTTGGDSARWKIRAGATAEVERADGTVEWRGCKSCGELFE